MKRLCQQLQGVNVTEALPTTPRHTPDASPKEVLPTLEPVLAEPADPKPCSDQLSNLQLGAFVVAKMVLIPAITIPIIIFMADHTLPSSLGKQDSDLIKLLLVLESATPSADTVMGIGLQFGLVRACTALSRAYLMQYLLSVLTMTIVVSIAFAWVYD